MRKLTKEEIEILQRHVKWLKSEEGGEKASLRGADLREASLHGASLHGASLHGADLYRANLSRANLREASLHGASLCEANLHGADLYRANLSRANLCGASLRETDLCEADLREADLRKANLHGADLYGANLYGTYGNVLSFGPIGSRRGITYVTKCGETIYVRCGCFYGTLEKFASHVSVIHGGSRHEAAYKAAIDFIKTIDTLYWTDVQKDQA